MVTRASKSINEASAYQPIWSPRQCAVARDGSVCVSVGLGVTVGGLVQVALLEEELQVFVLSHGMGEILCNVRWKFLHTLLI